ncbi:MAG: SPFH domain-containing protein [Planctomycetes bacterium]|nr:SPFH domain-containing protein [Planctomycetota bacterium]
MAIIDVVKWNAAPDLYAWKFPSEELATWTQLIVSESQEAVLLRGGQMEGPFPPGRHTLSTENLPVLRELFKLPFGGRTPFSAEVWFVNRTIPLDVKWGTSDPIQLQDPKYRVMLPVRSFGQFGVQIQNTRKFLVKLVGTVSSFERAQLVSYFRGLMITRVKDAVAKRIIKDNVSILEISAHLNDISNFLQVQMAGEFEEFGLKLVKFFINSINTPEDDPAVVRLKEALAKRAEMDIVGFNYQQQRSFDTLNTAAGNPGASGANLMGAGIGLGMGVGMGGAMGNAMGAVATSVQPTVHCPKCQAQNSAAASFCASCAAPLAQKAKAKNDPDDDTITCDKCGTKVVKGSKFCPNCADPFICCPKCGTDNPEGQPTCRKCGGPMPMKCSGCGQEVTGAPKFCPNCGKALQAKCSKCDSVLTPGVKFCPNCGTPRVA